MAKSRLVTQYEKFQEPGHRVGHPKERALYEQAKRYIVKNYDSIRSGYLEHIKEQQGIEMQDQEPTREELIEHFAKKAVVKREYTTTPMTNSELIENLAHTREFLPKKKQMVEASREGLKKFGYSKNSTKFLRYDEQVAKLGNITLANGTTGELTGEYISTNKKNNTDPRTGKEINSKYAGYVVVRVHNPGNDGPSYKLMYIYDPETADKIAALGL